MKVFISWSGDLSRDVAVILREWLPSVIQALDPFMSDEDIDSGTRWIDTIGRELEESSIGILCITRANMKAPWLNFEAGALSKVLDDSRVIPLLIDLRKSDLTGPLSQFQAQTVEKKDVLRMLTALNAHLRDNEVRPDVLQRSFENGWSDLATRVQKSIDEHSGDDKSTTAPVRDTAEILEEILELVRSQQRSSEATREPGPQHSIAARNRILFEEELAAKVEPLKSSGAFVLDRGGIGRPWDFRLRFHEPVSKTIIGKIYFESEKTSSLSSLEVLSFGSTVAIESADEGVIVTNRKPPQAAFDLADRLSSTVSQLQLVSVKTLNAKLEALVDEYLTAPESSPFDDDDLDDVPF